MDRQAIASMAIVSTARASVAIVSSTCEMERPVAVVMATIAMRPLMSSARGLEGQRRRSGRLWRRLARPPEAVAGRAVARPLPPLPVWAEPPETPAGAPWGGATRALPGGHFEHAARRQAHPPLLLVLDGAVLDG